MKNISKSKKVFTLLLTLAISFVLLTSFSSNSYGRETILLNAVEQDNSSTTKLPETAEEHYKKAESYKQKASEYRKEAQEHRQMKVEYGKKIYQHPKDRVENPWMKKMRLHCDKYIIQAEALAKEAEKMAEYHTFRAKELEGK
ncbi:MAG: hypothetical protein J0M03_24430 [Acidobacteria bacterium]|nr:hypothetical protein [Acidobacteriota bacterium]